MGQRLVISVENNEKKLCNLYYHWSAYTLSALDETKKLIDCIYNHKDESEKELLLRLIRFCEENGGCIDGGSNSEEGKYIQRLYPNETFKETGSRSEGLIALSEKGMSEMQSWSEGDVYINIDTDQVDFCVYNGYETLDEYIRERESWDEDFDASELNHMPTFDFCLGYFDVKDIDKILACIDDIDGDVVIKCDGEICELIG